MWRLAISSGGKMYDYYKSSGGKMWFCCNIRAKKCEKCLEVRAKKCIFASENGFKLLKSNKLCIEI